MEKVNTRLIHYAFFALSLVLVLGCSRSADPDKNLIDYSVDADFLYYGSEFQKFSNVSYGEDSLQNMDIYAPMRFVGEPTWWEPRESTKPVIIHIHGGGWIGGDKVDQEPVFSPYLQKGYPVVNVNYRLGPGTAPQAAEDVLCALAWLSDHKDEYNLDLSNVVITGQSAGGHLALFLGLAANHPEKTFNCNVPDNLKVLAIVNWAGITDMMKLNPHFDAYDPTGNYFKLWVSDDSQEQAISDLYSPYLLVYEDCPPVLTIHGDNDMMVPFEQALIMDQALEKVGGFHQIHAIAGGNHFGFSNEQYTDGYKSVFSFLEDLE